MAIQVSGTEVISNARNISNVGTVTATNFVGGGAGLTGLSAAPFAPDFDPLATPDVTLTSSSTWTKPALDASSWVTIWMIGGGGGGRIDTDWANGGTGGNAVLFSMLASGLPASIAFTVGAGGASNSSGGDTSCTISGVTYIANGGIRANGSTMTVTPGTGVYAVPYNGLPPFSFGAVPADSQGGWAFRASPGGTSVYGGGGGGSFYGGTPGYGGVSTYGGNGGNTTASTTCTNGATPGGGGGGKTSGTACSGGAGRVFIYYG